LSVWVAPDAIIAPRPRIYLILALIPLILPLVLARFLLSLALVLRRLRLSLARFFGSPVRSAGPVPLALALPASTPNPASG
jgi:hypothetical protein